MTTDSQTVDMKDPVAMVLLTIVPGGTGVMTADGGDEQVVLEMLVPIVEKLRGLEGV